MEGGTIAEVTETPTIIVFVYFFWETAKLKIDLTANLQPTGLFLIVCPLFTKTTRYNQPVPKLYLLTHMIVAMTLKKSRTF